MRRLLSGASVAEQRALLDGLLSGRVTSLLDRLRAEPVPSLGPVPAASRGFGVRLELRGSKPPVWRRLVVPGDLTLPRLHDVIQAAMGWQDSHLHRFRIGRDPRSPHFVTQFDVEEGDDGVLEDEVRLDQLVAAEGDQLWYEYDFGDGWDHVLLVEQVVAGMVTPRCTAGRMSCPPEDCGGIGGYHELAAWVRGGYDDALLPEPFDTAVRARDWLPVDWHPDTFDVAEADAAVTAALAEPVAVAAELAALNDRLERRGNRQLREVLSRPAVHDPVEVTDAEEARLTDVYRVFLDSVGDGVTLTAAGYLPPAVVEAFAERSGITSWWIGKANREDLTPPVAAVRDTARALGLISVRRRRLAPTAAGTRCRSDATLLRQHIVTRPPLGKTASDREAGWIALAIVASGVSPTHWRSEISELLYALGWSAPTARPSRPAPDSPTLEVLHQLAGEARHRRPQPDHEAALAATCRAVIRRQP